MKKKFETDFEPIQKYNLVGSKNLEKQLIFDGRILGLNPGFFGKIQMSKRPVMDDN